MWCFNKGQSVFLHIVVHELKQSLNAELHGRHSEDDCSGLCLLHIESSLGQQLAHTMGSADTTAPTWDPRPHSHQADKTDRTAGVMLFPRET